MIAVAAASQSQLTAVTDQLNALIAKMPIAKASLKLLPFAPTAAPSVSHVKHASQPTAPVAGTGTGSGGGVSGLGVGGGGRSFIAGKPEKHVLVLGSGFVAGPLVEYLARRNAVTVASALIEEAKSIADGHPNVRTVQLDANDSNAVREHVRRADLVVSFLPAPYHVAIANHCIAEKKHLVTASYVSPGLKALNDAASGVGITILNEVGLDPGIDHMSALKVIHEVQAAGGVVESFESVCGGLPAPECADNPLGYKFSWSPRGVLTATQNSAKFLRDGKVVDISAADLLRSAQPIELNTSAYNLECLPNRDSLSYATDYGLQSAKTLFRGTLRYRGFSSIVDQLKSIGLISADKWVNPNQHQSWVSVCACCFVVDLC